MSNSHLKERKFYEDIYDKHTVEWGRRNYKSFLGLKAKFFELNPDKKEGDFGSTFHLNWMYMMLVGNELLDRYDGRENYINDWMSKDEAQDTRVSDARLTSEPVCQHCGKTGLRITDKMLMHRDGIDTPEEVIFMLNCPACSKRSSYWEDGSPFEHRQTYCPNCKAVMTEKASEKAKVLTTTYTCTSCKHSYKDKMDFNPKDEPIDPDLESDKYAFCLLDEKSLNEHRDAKRRFEDMVRLGKELKEKEENKDLYEALDSLKKPKIAELSTLLAPALEKAGYIEFSLDKPEMGKDVFIGFNCLDSKSDRSDYDSQKDLKKIVDKALIDTNWRLMSEGISYRLGYLNGRLRAYEREEDLLNLVKRGMKLKPKQQSSVATSKKANKVYKTKTGRKVIL